MASIYEVADLVAAWLRLFFLPGDVTELRAIGASRLGYKKPHIEAGFFDYEHLGEMALAAMRITEHARGVYFVMNPLRSDILARCSNRIEASRSESLACDRDVIARRWLLIDCDPVRDPLVSATDDEKETARIMADGIAVYLREAGWPAPIRGDSGNGYHLFYRVDLPNDEASKVLVSRILNALGERFDTPACKVDRKVFNASRIVKLPATLARKGDDRPERPHRRSRLLEVPGVDLQAIAGRVKAEHGMTAESDGESRSASEEHQS